MCKIGIWGSYYQEIGISYLGIRSVLGLRFLVHTTELMSIKTIYELFVSSSVPTDIGCQLPEYRRGTRLLSTW